jgi:hypothetical protein
METFASYRAFVHNKNFDQQRKEALKQLDESGIDPPIIDIVRGFSKLHYCFTLQSCFGHFTYPGNRDLFNCKPLPRADDIDWVKYRIAYLAVCIQESTPGKQLLDDLAGIPAIDPQYIQFGSPEWFWDRQPNAYALQVEPAKYMMQDICRIEYREALHVEQVRNEFFDRIRDLLQSRM